MADPSRHLFEAFGVELEYMIVDAETLSVRPIADRLIYEVAGRYVSEIELGDVAWSNELAQHVVELKTNGPVGSLESLSARFQDHVARVNHLLRPMNARLLPTAMHPWMDPHAELRLWPHEQGPIYEAFNRIFDCRGHGWANLQSVHLNLPFADDAEFGRLHAAIRLLMPIMPALAASSPVVDRKVTGILDNRMRVYQGNARRVPSVAAAVVPEPVFTRADYEEQILRRIYRDIAPLDPEGVLQHEWLNARGAIARFDRNTIEVRVLDVQECPQADLAICAAIVAVLRAMTDQRWTSTAEQQAMATGPLAALLNAVVRDAEDTVIDDAGYLAHFGSSKAPSTARELWQHLIDELIPASSPWKTPLETILSAGTLARRILCALAGDLDGRLLPVYRRLADRLAEGRLFVGDPLD